MHPQYTKLAAMLLTKAVVAWWYFASHAGAGAGLSESLLFAELLDSFLSSLWFFMGHYFEPDLCARSIGWPVGSRFQEEIAWMNGSVSCHCLLALVDFPRWDLIMSAVLVRGMLYLGCGAVHLRSVAEDDNWAWSNASFTLLMNDDILAAARGIFLYLAAAHKHESLDLVGGVIGAVLLLWAGQLSYRYFTGERSRRGL